MRLHWFALAILWGSLIWHLTTTPQPIIFNEPWYQSLLMSGAHFSFFGIQACLNKRVISQLPLAPYFALVVTSLYGLAIELVQINISGRTADPMDWVLDTLGALTFLSLTRFLFRI